MIEPAHGKHQQSARTRTTVDRALFTRLRLDLASREALGMEPRCTFSAEREINGSDTGKKEKNKEFVR